VKIGIHCLCTHPTYKGGTNSFTFGLLDGLARAQTTAQLTIFVAPWNRSAFEQYEHFDLVEITEALPRWANAIERRLPVPLRGRLPVASPSARLRRKQAAIVPREVDVLYVPYVPPEELFPLPDIPTVYSIHDIQQVHYPEFFTAEEIRLREVAFRLTVDHASVIQASSRAMAREFCDHFAKLDESNVAVIPEGVDIALFSQTPPDDAVTAKYELPESFLFTPAQLWPHKNHLTVLKALERLRKRGLVVPLVLTGAEYGAAPAIFDFIAANGLDDQVFHLGVVPFEDIIALHQRARFLVTASLYESSSLPILEAAAAGTPIIAGRIPAHEEMAEHLAMRLFPPTDDAALADVLEQAWTAGDEVTQAQVAANRAGVERYSWDNAARMYIQLFERIHRERLAGR
jgi:glycosyltransferase involved in cell wall biosynthesis